MPRRSSSHAPAELAGGFGTFWRLWTRFWRFRDIPAVVGKSWARSGAFATFRRFQECFGGFGCFGRFRMFRRFRECLDGLRDGTEGLPRKPASPHLARAGRTQYPGRSPTGTGPGRSPTGAPQESKHFAAPRSVTDRGVAKRQARACLSDPGRVGNTPFSHFSPKARERRRPGAGVVAERGRNDQKESRER